MLCTRALCVSGVSASRCGHLQKNGIQQRFATREGTSGRRWRTRRIGALFRGHGFFLSPSSVSLLLLLFAFSCCSLIGGQCIRYAANHRTVWRRNVMVAGTIIIVTLTVQSAYPMFLFSSFEILPQRRQRNQQQPARLETKRSLFASFQPNKFSFTTWFLALIFFVKIILSSLFFYRSVFPVLWRWPGHLLTSIFSLHPTPPDVFHFVRPISLRECIDLFKINLLRIGSSVGQAATLVRRNSFSVFFVFPEKEHMHTQFPFQRLKPH